MKKIVSVALAAALNADVNAISREVEAELARIEAEGGKVAGSVSGSTDYLITNNPESGSSKNRAARELGVSIITEEDILGMIGQSEQ